jgi:hypothetical protein
MTLDARAEVSKRAKLESRISVVIREPPAVGFEWACERFRWSGRGGNWDL